MKQAAPLNFTQTQQTLLIHILTKLQLQTYANMKMAVTYSGQLKLKKNIQTFLATVYLFENQKHRIHQI